MSRFAVVGTVTALLGLSAVSQAAIIFDQLGTGGTAETGLDAYVSQRFSAGDLGNLGNSYSVIAVEDFTTTQAWHLTNISFGMALFNGASLSPTAITGYEVKIYTAAAGTAPNAPLTGNVLNATLAPGAATVGAAGFAGYVSPTPGFLVSLDLSSLNFNLAAGSYWIGVMPQNSYDANGETGIMASTMVDPSSVATNSRWINPGGGFGLANNNDLISDINNNHFNLSYQISATPVPEPASMAILGVGALALLRRRFKKA